MTESESGWKTIARVQHQSSITGLECILNAKLIVWSKEDILSGTHGIMNGCKHDLVDWKVAELMEAVAAGSVATFVALDEVKRTVVVVAAANCKPERRK